jgi:hypothetical protein
VYAKILSDKRRYIMKIERKLRDAKAMLEAISVEEVNYRIEDLKDKIEGGYDTEREMEEHNLLLAEREVLLTSGVGEKIDKMIRVLSDLISRQMIERRDKMNLPQDHWGGYDENDESF